MSKWLSYYHPSTTVFVDDQQAFLTAVKNRLPSHFLALFFNDAKKALLNIKELSSQCEHPQRIIEIEDDIEIDLKNNNEAFFNLKLGEVWKTIYDPRRFSEVSVVIVDRIMPDLDGISFCRELIDSPVKKIMLTASKDRKIATEAFNEGIIDFFLLKDSSNLIQQLMVALGNLQREYFSDLTKRTLGSTLEIAAHLAKNDASVTFVQNMMQELNAVEFYLLDKWGSTLFLTYDGTPFTLVIAPEKMMDTYASIALEHEERSIANALLKREKLLFFPHQTDSMCPPSRWNNFLFDCSQLPEQPGVFYTLISLPQIQPINIEKVYSQKNYII